MKRSGFTRKPPKKKVAKKRTKLPTVKTVRNKCDKLLTPIIKAQHPVCFLQGSESCAYHTQVAHHHIHKSKSTALRYNLDNLIPLCHACHLMLHQNESKWASHIVSIKGIAWFEGIRAQDVIVKADVHFYLENLLRLEAVYLSTQSYS